jgi:hypothetical protein
MLDKQAYTNYLDKKAKNKKIIEERERFFDKLNEIHSQNGKDVLSSFINDFLQCYQWSMVEVQKAFNFLSDYVSFGENENGTCNKPHEYAGYSLSIAGFVARLSLESIRRYLATQEIIMRNLMLKNLSKRYIIVRGKSCLKRGMTTCRKQLRSMTL